MRRAWLAAVLLVCATALFLPAAVSPALAADTSPSFSDVPESHPYFEAIEQMAAAQVINGFAGGTFHPDDVVTRQQFAKMIVLSLGLDPLPATQNPFRDVGSGWPHPSGYVAVAAARGITVGISATTFNPGGNVKRAQISTMMVRAAQNLALVELTAAPTGYLSDWGNFSPDHAAFANTADYSGLFEGLLFDFYKDPWKLATRGEVAQLLWNLRSFVKQTKAGDGLFEVTDLLPAEIPAGFLRALDDVASLGTLEWVRRLRVEHPVNANVVVELYYAKVDDDYFAGAEGSRGFTVAPLVATFLTHLDGFGAEVVYVAYDSSDPDDPTVASLLCWKLGGDYARQGTETVEQYGVRIQPPMADFLQQHADSDEFFFLSHAAVRELIRTSDSLEISDPAAGLEGVRLRVDLHRAYDQGALIEALAGHIWPWEE